MYFAQSACVKFISGSIKAQFYMKMNMKHNKHLDNSKSEQLIRHQKALELKYKLSSHHSAHTFHTPARLRLRPENIC